MQPKLGRLHRPYGGANRKPWGTRFEVAGWETCHLFRVGPTHPCWVWRCIGPKPRTFAFVAVGLPRAYRRNSTLSFLFTCSCKAAFLGSECLPLTSLLKQIVSSFCETFVRGVFGCITFATRLWVVHSLLS